MGDSLEWMFKVDAKIDGVAKMLEKVVESNKALHDLDKATSHTSAGIEKVGHASEHAAGKHDKHAHSILNVGHQYAYAKRGLMEFGEALGLVLAYEAVEKLVDKTIEWGEEILKAAGAAERTEKSFGALLGEEGGKQTIEEVEAIARHTEFATEKVLGLTAGLLRVGFAGEGLRRARAAALDLAALPGGNLEEAASALERIRRTGHVDNRTLGGIGFGENDFLTALSKRSGKPSAVLKKDMEKGKLDVNQALESLYDLIHKRTGKALGGVGVEMSETLSAHITHLKEAPEELYRALSETEAFDKLSAMLGDLAEQLQPDGEIGKHLVTGLKAAFTEVVDFVDSIDWAVGFETIKSTIEETIPLLKAMGELAGSTFGAIADVDNWVQGGRKKVLGALGIKVETDRERDKREFDESPEAKALDAKIAQHKARLRDLRAAGAFNSGPGDAFDRVGDKWVRKSSFGAGTGLQPPGALARPPEAKFIQDGSGKWGLNPASAGSAGEAVGKATGEGIVAGAKEGLGTHSPSAEFEWMGRMSAAGFQRGMGAGGAPGGPGGRGAGAVQVSVHVETHVDAGHAGDPQQVGQAVAAHLDALLPGALQSAFEKMRLEAGT